MKREEFVESLPEKQISVLLAEDHASFRKSLRLLIEFDGDIEVEGEAKNGREAVRMTKSLHPEVIVMDLTMPFLNGLQATEEIMAQSPGTRVLILSAHPDPEYIKKAVRCGASGYLIKQSSTHVLAHAIREVFKGNSFFCAPITKALCEECKKVFGKAELLKKKAACLSIPCGSEDH
jgi:DNA-binding NarL/FixJ family response regulator